MKKLFALLLAAMLTSGNALHAQQTVEIAPPPAAASDGAASDGAASDGARRAQDVQVPDGLKAGEIAIRDRESGEWIITHDAVQSARTAANLYLEGGWMWMTLITLCLAGMFFSAWKAPRWIKEFGLLARSLGIFSLALGLYAVFDLLSQLGSTASFSLLCGGLRVALIAPMYGLGVYMLSLALRLALKPRI